MTKKNCLPFIILLTLPLILLPAMKAVAHEKAKKVIQLSEPNFSKGGTVLTALKKRHSSRDFKATPLSHEDLSNILWAAAGVNRELPDNRKGRTAPSSNDSQAIDVFAVTQQGAYQYDYRKHQLLLISEGDLRPATGIQKYVATAPLTLIFVLDLYKIQGADDIEKNINGALDIGHWSENSYIYAVSSGLGAIVRTNINKEQLKTVLKLNSYQEVVLAQTIGFID